jgi:hypothetical protein
LEKDGAGEGGAPEIGRAEECGASEIGAPGEGGASKTAVPGKTKLPKSIQESFMDISLTGDFLLPALSSGGASALRRSNV